MFPLAKKEPIPEEEKKHQAKYQTKYDHFQASSITKNCIQCCAQAKCTQSQKYYISQFFK